MPPTFLVNCYGMAWEEVTASSIIEIDLEGNIIDPGDQELPRVQAAAFAIHGAVHMAHMDSGAAQCVMHTHEAYVTALSSLKCGLLPLTQTALIAGPVAYHPCKCIAPFASSGLLGRFKKRVHRRPAPLRE